jgi:hypothetical protein
MTSRASHTTVIRVKKRDDPYVILDKLFLSNNALSWKAKGLLAYLLSKPDDWQIAENDLIRQSKDGRDAVRAGLRELEIHGYLTRRQIRVSGGKFARTEYVVYERPEFNTSGKSEGELQEAPPSQARQPSNGAEITVAGKSVHGGATLGKSDSYDPTNGKSAPTALGISTSQARQPSNGAEITVAGKSVHGGATTGKSDSNFVADLEAPSSQTREPLGDAGLNRRRIFRRRKIRHLLNNELTNNHVVVVVRGDPPNISKCSQTESAPPPDGEQSPDVDESLRRKQEIILAAFPDLHGDIDSLAGVLRARSCEEVREAVTAVSTYNKRKPLDNLIGSLRDAIENCWTCLNKSPDPKAVGGRGQDQKAPHSREKLASGRDRERERRLIKKLYLS